MNKKIPKRILFSKKEYEALGLLSVRHRGNINETVREAVRRYYAEVQEQIELIKEQLEVIEEKLEG